MFSPSPRCISVCDINAIEWAEYNRWYKLDEEKVKEIKDNLDKETPVLVVRESEGKRILVRGYHALQAMKEAGYTGKVRYEIDDRTETEIILGILKEKLELAFRIKGVENVDEWKGLKNIEKSYECSFVSKRDRYWLLNRLYSGLKEEGYTHSEARDYIEEQLCEHRTSFTQKLRCIYYIHPHLTRLVDERSLSNDRLMQVVNASIDQQLELSERIRECKDDNITTAFIDEGVNMGLFHKKNPKTNEIRYIGVKRNTTTNNISSQLPEYISSSPLPHIAFSGDCVELDDMDIERAETSGCVDDEDDLVPVTVMLPRDTAKTVNRLLEQNESLMIKIICVLVRAWENFW